MKLVVWLGNPWQSYKATRHNIWATMLERFLDWEKVWKLKYDNKWKAEILTTDQFWERVIFCAPQTYMNLSWESVWPLAQFYKIKPENIIVIHDDKDLALGKIKAKIGGSAGGHNGLKNIDAHIGTEFLRA